MSLFEVLFFAVTLTIIYSDLTKSLTKLDEFSRRSAVSRISIASASTASLYRSQDIQGTSALPPKKSKEKDKKSSAPTGKTSKLPIVTSKAASHASKAPITTNLTEADSRKKKNAPVKDTFVQDDYSMDIDYGNDDLPIPGDESHDFDAKYLGKLCSCFCPSNKLTIIQMQPKSLPLQLQTCQKFQKLLQSPPLLTRSCTANDLPSNLNKKFRLLRIILQKSEVQK